MIAPASENNTVFGLVSMTERLREDISTQTLGEEVRVHDELGRGSDRQSCVTSVEI